MLILFEDTWFSNNPLSHPERIPAEMSWPGSQEVRDFSFQPWCSGWGGGGGLCGAGMLCSSG